MSLLLNIDTSLETASVSISENAVILGKIINLVQKDHASFLHNAIKKLADELSLELRSLDAVAVTLGPGSYTGLRVGMATAKGLCYALDKPFIGVSTLDALAKTAIDEINKKDAAFFCPLIDARRMEVFTAIFNDQMNEVIKPSAIILNENSFKEILEKKQICFFGSGSKKLENILRHKNAIFIRISGLIHGLCKLSFEKFSNRQFTDIAHSEPFYLKDFYSPTQ